MNKTYFFFLILFIFIFQSCSVLIDNDNQTIKNISYRSNRSIEELFCAKNSNQLFSKNGKFLPKNINFQGTIAEQIVQHILLEMYYNPDSITDRSRVQLFYKTKLKNKYIETLDSKAGILNHLNQFLKIEKSIKTLSELNQNVLTKIPNGILASHSLAKFISTNKKEISKNPLLATLFLKGDDTLAPFETFKKVPLKIPTKFQNSEFKTESQLTSYPLETNTIHCNFDLAQIQEFTSSLTKSENTDAYYFGKQMNNDEMYIVVISSNIKSDLKNTNDHYLITGEETKEAIPFCFQQLDHKFIYSISTEGRDPAQHLSHFLDYGLFESENLIDLVGHMKFTRHLFLKNPDRLLFESQKARTEQMSFYHTMNIPLYHMEKIGNVLFWGQFNKRKEASFIIDERGTGEIRCQ